MLTDNELRLGYYERFKRPLDDDNLAALKRFIRNFELEDYTDFQEMYNAIQLSMRDISNELQTTDDPRQQREIMRRRYAKL